MQPCCLKYAVWREEREGAVAGCIPQGFLTQNHVYMQGCQHCDIKIWEVTIAHYIYILYACTTITEKYVHVDVAQFYRVMRTCAGLLREEGVYDIW